MNFFKSMLRLIASPIFIGVIITSGITALAFLFYARAATPDDERSTFFRAMQLVHEKLIDVRLRDRGPRKGSPDVAVLAVDERAVEHVGRWPWSRDKIAHVVDQVIANGGRVIAFDMTFSEPDSNSAAPALTRLRDDIRESQLSSPALLKLIDKEVLSSNTDQQFADVVEKHKSHLVMGGYYDEGGQLASYQDLCWDLAYPKTISGQNYGHEALPAVVNDTTALSLPTSWSQVLEEHFSHLTTRDIQKWIKAHQRELKTIQSNRSQAESQLIIQAWLEKDRDKLSELLKSSKKTSVETQILETSHTLTHLRGDLLASEIERTLRACCGRFLTNTDELNHRWQKTWSDLASDEQWKHLSGLGFEEGVKALKEFVLENPIHSMDRYWMNIPELISASEHNAFFNAHLDSDAAIRTARLIARSGNNYHTSLPTKAYLLGKSYNVKATIERNLNVPHAKKVSAFEIIDDEGNPVTQLPVDSAGRMMINYAGPRYMFPHISVADLMTNDPDLTVLQTVQNPTTQKWEVRESKQNKKEFLKGKYFIAGATAVGIYDLRVTPFEENFPGVETHANVLDNLLRGDFLHVNENEEIYMPLIVLGLGISLTLLLNYFGAVAGFLLMSATLLSLYAVDKYIFFRNGIVTAIALPIFLTLSLYLFLTFYKYFTEERKKKELKGTFEKYVSPAIVDEILADPSNLELGGRKETVTVFFSDVRGFTTISEKLDPSALSNLLNSYLTPMTRLVFEHKGTLDKYMGDAIMAFFGAPIHYADHAKHVCRCALAHLDKLKELQAEYERKGLPSIDIGIGLNTGEVNVGNMGSDIVRNYTVMGDAVNLGSRLEGINKQYGTRIIISEYTYKEVKDDFVTREIDRVRVKGKVQPVQIYELIKEGAPSEDVTEMLKWFKQGYQFYHEQQWEKAIASFTAALNAKPNDECSKLYMQRCLDYLENSPGPDWDGVCVMKTK